MIATIGASVEVWVFSSPADRKRQEGGGPVQARDHQRWPAEGSRCLGADADLAAAVAARPKGPVPPSLRGRGR